MVTIWSSARVAVAKLQAPPALAVALDSLPPRRRALVVSIVGGKAAGTMLATLGSRFDDIFVTRSTNDRALDPEILVAIARVSLVIVMPIALTVGILFSSRGKL